MNIITNNGLQQMDFNFMQEVKERSCQPIDLCYQCQRCASGCQVGSYIDFQPNQIIRMIQFGLKDELLKSSAIWLCVNCDTCGARCPNEISISAVTDALREMAIEQNVAASEKRVHVFHDNFLNAVKSGARVHEVTMLMKYKLRSGDLFSDIKMGLDLFTRGKLPLLPSKVKNKDKVKQIFNKINDNQTHLNVCAKNNTTVSVEERG
ncbi:4Fe-4S dicluster domain-containing protein [Peptococcaceae bacterium 1198_IL3148]